MLTAGVMLTAELSQHWLQECKLKAVQEMVPRFAANIDYATQPPPEGPEALDPVVAVAQLYQSKAHGESLASLVSSCVWARRYGNVPC